MEASNKKNMALKLELWLSAKQSQSGASTPAPSPLRQVNHSTSSQRRVSGILSMISSVEGSPTNRRKSFSRVMPPSDEDLRKKQSSSMRVATSPSKTRQMRESVPSPNAAQFSVFSEDNSDENSKENHPCQDQNITHVSPNVRQKVTKRQSPSPISKSVSCSDLPFTGSQILDKRLRLTQSSPELSESSDSIETSLRNENCPQGNPYHTSSANKNDLEMKATLLEEELHAMMFLNSILEQRINELEQAISIDRLESNETISNRGKKHKAELKKLALERSNYEERAHQMITQVTEQMALLQSTAMGRIEVLENDLLEERHSTEALRQEVLHLNSAIAASKAHSMNSSAAEGDCDVPDDAVDGNDYSETDSISGTEVLGSACESDADASMTDDNASVTVNEEEEVEEDEESETNLFDAEEVFRAAEDEAPDDDENVTEVEE